jgi:hypothetical protein
MFAEKYAGMDRGNMPYSIDIYYLRKWFGMVICR